MADDKEEVKIVFDTNANEASKEVIKLEKSLISVEEAEIKLKKATDDLNNSQGKSAAEIKALEINQRKAKIAYDEANLSLKESKKAHDDVSKSANGQVATMGALDKGLGGAISSMKGMLKQMWLIVANPLGLILVAIVGTLALLFKAFTSTKAGGEKLERIMAGVSATIDVLRDRFLQFFDALASFDFDAIVASFTGIGDEIEREAKIAAKATGELQKVADAQRDLEVSRSALNKELAESERILTSTNSTYAEKLEALKRVEIAEGKQTEQELANAKRKYEALGGLNALSDTNAENAQKAADALIKVNELEQKSAEDRRKISDFNKTLANEENARLKAISDERKARQKEEDDARKARQKEIDDENKRIADEKQKVIDAAQAISDAAREANDLIAKTDLERLTEKYEAEKALLEQSLIDTFELEKKYANDVNDLKIKQQEFDDAAIAKTKADEEAAAKNKIALDKVVAENRINTGISTLQNLSALGKKGNAIGKTAAVAQTTIDTYKGATSAFSSLSGIPIVGPALGAVAAGAAVAAGFVNVKKILSTGEGGGGGGGGSAPAIPSIPTGINAGAQVGFQASGENQIASSIAKSQKDQPPLKAFVVGSDVTTQQTLDAKLVKQNSFGG